MQYFYFKLPVLRLIKGDNQKNQKKNHVFTKLRCTFQWGKINTLIHVFSNKGGTLVRRTAMATLCLPSILQAKPMPKKS